MGSLSVTLGLLSAIAAAFRFTAVIFKPRAFRYALTIVHISALLQATASAAASHSLLWPIPIHAVSLYHTNAIARSSTVQLTYLSSSWCCVAKCIYMLILFTSGKRWEISYRVRAFKSRYSHLYLFVGLFMKCYLSQSAETSVSQPVMSMHDTL